MPSPDGSPARAILLDIEGTTTAVSFVYETLLPIRIRTMKFLYVLSKTSNTKDGPRSELQIAINVAKAEKIKDFVIPLHIDDLPHTEINVLLAKLIAVPFEAGWARGYQQLLEKLEREGVPKKPNFGPEAVTSWWREQFSSERGVSEASEKYRLTPPHAICVLGREGPASGNIRHPWL